MACGTAGGTAGQIAEKRVTLSSTRIITTFTCKRIRHLFDSSLCWFLATTPILNACDRKQHLDITIQLMTVDVWIRGI